MARRRSTAGVPLSLDMGPDTREKLGAVMAEIYGELHRMAARLMRNQPAEITLQTTALIHEGYLKMADAEDLVASDPGQVFGLASHAMRQVLIDHVRRRGRLKRTPPGQRQPLDDLVGVFEQGAVDLLALDEALTRLEADDPVMAQAVEMRFFGGLSMAETARSLEIPERTFDRRWNTIRRRLFLEVR